MNGFNHPPMLAYDFSMAVIHISEAEAASDFTRVMDHVRAGDDVRIDSGSTSYTVVPAISTKSRLISDVLAELERRGSTALLPEGFAEAVEDGILSHQNEPRFDPWE